MDYQKEALKLHYELRGKLEVSSRAKTDTKDELSLAYTPGVAAACLEIQKDVSLSYELTRRWNTVAVVTDGSAVLGLGDIGPEAAMPVMEGKCVLFKNFADVDAIPLCLRTQDTDEIVRTISLLSGSFGGINLEDISAPRCFEIEEKLKKTTDIPIFHDDQHGTAVVTISALINALKLVGKDFRTLKVAISGAGAAGVAIARLLKAEGVSDILMCNRSGIVCKGNDNMNAFQKELASWTNPERRKGSLADAMVGADVFIGVSAPDIVSGDMVRAMAENSIVLPMANPVPEIMPAVAKEAGAAVVGTGRSDFPNQINNVLAFPGIFRGALDVRARDINEAMKLAAARALAALVSDEELSADYIIPAAFDERVAGAVAAAVAQAARESGLARI